MIISTIFFYLSEGQFPRIIKKLKPHTHKLLESGLKAGEVEESNFDQHFALHKKWPTEQNDDDLWPTDFA